MKIAQQTIDSIKTNCDLVSYILCWTIGRSVDEFAGSKGVGFSFCRCGEGQITVLRIAKIPVQVIWASETGRETH